MTSLQALGASSSYHHHLAATCINSTPSLADSCLFLRRSLLSLIVLFLRPSLSSTFPPHLPFNLACPLSPSPQGQPLEPELGRDESHWLGP